MWKLGLVYSSFPVAFGRWWGAGREGGRGQKISNVALINRLENKYFIFKSDMSTYLVNLKMTENGRAKSCNDDDNRNFLLAQSH